MNGLQKLDALAQSLEAESMGIRLSIEVGADAAVVDLQVIVSIPGEGQEAGYGCEVGARTSEAAVEMLLTDLDTGGLAEARRFRDERLRQAALKGFAERRGRKRQLDQPEQEGQQS
jgi:hypothetical protein